MKRLPPDPEFLPSGPRPARRGVVALEMIFWVPIQVILVMAIVEFAIIMQVNRQVAYSSEFGAKLASEITRDPLQATNLSNYNMLATPNDLKERIDEYLANHGLTASCEVRLEHNACVDNPLQVQTANACACGASATALQAGEPPAGEAYVRVTVCVELLNNVPNVLSTFGFDITGYTIEHSTTFRIETNNATPSAVITVPIQALPAGYTASPDITTVNVTSPPTVNVTITAPNSAGTGETFTVNFNANASTDTETPFANLTFQWVITSPDATVTAVGPTTNATFVAQFTVPGTMGGAGATDVNDSITLQVTDSCNTTGSRNLSVFVSRAP